MAEFNQYSLYSMTGDTRLIQKDDEVDVLVKKLIEIDEYDDVKKIVLENFGDIEREKLIEYSNINKQLNILITDEKIEICAAKQWKQYFGKGWVLVDK